MEERLRRLEQKQVSLASRMSMAERHVTQLHGDVAQIRDQRRSDFGALKEDLELIHRELSSWAGARRALVWVFGAIMTGAGVVAAIVAALAGG